MGRNSLPASVLGLRRLPALRGRLPDGTFATLQKVSMIQWHSCTPATLATLQLIPWGRAFGRQGAIRADVKKPRLVSDLQGRGWRAFALRAYRRDHVNVFPFLSRDDKMARVALPDQDTA